MVKVNKISELVSNLENENKEMKKRIEALERKLEDEKFQCKCLISVCKGLKEEIDEFEKKEINEVPIIEKKKRERKKTTNVENMKFHHKPPKSQEEFNIRIDVEDNIFFHIIKGVNQVEEFKKHRNTINKEIKKRMKALGNIKLTPYHE
jgi:hypothetical protein